MINNLTVLDLTGGGIDIVTGILLVCVFLLVFCLFSPDIVFLIHKKHFIWKNSTEWGYSTPRQLRYKVGDCVTTLDNKIWKIKETGRHDYLVEDSEGNLKVIFHTEIKEK